MSLLPYVFGYDRPHRHWPSGLIDQDIGLTSTPNDMLPIPRDFLAPWNELSTAARELCSSIKADKDKFQVNLDVQHFAPEEISVKTGNGYLVVEGKHEEKRDQHGFVSRQFTRRYALPDGCRVEGVQCQLSSDGVLTVTAPREPLGPGERAVPIQQTGPVRKEIKDQTQEVEFKKKK